MSSENDILIQCVQEINRNKRASVKQYAALNALVILGFVYLKKVPQR